MAQYKVIQDIEAEDKLLGPLSLRQFIYAVIVVALGFVAFQMSKIAWYFVLPFLPPMGFFGLLAAPFGTTQSSEVWLLAKIRYFLFPKRRIWDKDGIQELVHITVPKKVEENLTKDFSKEEVQSRLQALANTLDSRGWIIKNVTPDVFRTATAYGASQDRLLDINMLEQKQQDLASPDEDVLDPAGQSPIAQTMNTLLQNSTDQHRQEIMAKMRAAATPQAQNTQMPSQTVAPAVATNQANPIVSSNTQPATTANPQAQQPAPEAPQTINNPVTSGAKSTGADLLFGTYEPQAEQPLPSPEPTQKPAMTKPANTDKIANVNDKNRDALEINRDQNQSDDDGEVVISLH